MLKYKLIPCLLFIFLATHAQVQQYQYRRTLTGVTGLWHTIELPYDLLGKAQPSLADIRIMGFKGKDTIEVPYLVKVSNGAQKIQRKSFTIINQTYGTDGYYYTFKAENAGPINEIGLDFKEENFDWNVVLYGSNDNSRWFVINDSLRVAGIRKGKTVYKFTDLNFKPASFAYYRIRIAAPAQPALVSAELISSVEETAAYTDVPYTLLNLKAEPRTRETQVELILKDAVPVAFMHIDVANKLDFYRDISVEYAVDSTDTGEGIRYNYQPLFTGVLNSFDLRDFHFAGQRAIRLKLTIYNEDNPQLWIKAIELKALNHRLLARFPEQDYTYFLFYGNTKASQPAYELANFENHIPAGAAVLTTGDETKNPQFVNEAGEPFFKDKLWLWGLMAVIVLLLGWFSFKMLSGK